MGKREEKNATESEDKVDESNDSKEMAKIDPYLAALDCEEHAVRSRSERDDQASFASICKKLRAIMKDILRLKTEKPENWSVEVEDLKVKGLMHMLSLRRLSRIQKVRVKESREKSTEFRQGVDAITLQLQNLLYEVSHLKKEVRKCLEFKSADTEIDLVSVDQFYKEAPENISRPEETVEDAHQQRLAQLHWELEQRRGQTQLTDKLTQEKDKVAELISEQEGRLASLLPRINAILEATQPLQKSLNLPLDAKREQQKTSQLLPAPLYTLWVQATSYGEAYDSSIIAEIMGDVEAAKKLVAADDDAKTEASDSDGEMEMHEENVARKSRSRTENKNQEPDDSEDLSLKQLLALHPLHIALTIRTKSNNAVSMKFFYATSLRIVTTKCSLDLAESSKALLTDILNSDSLLTLLFNGDTGTETPNPANEYQFQKLRLNGLTAEHIKIIGRPYKWAQTLSGLSFLAPESSEDESYATSRPSLNKSIAKEENLDEPPMSPEDKSQLLISTPQKHCSETLSWKVSAEHMHHIITAIKRRLQARLALHSQFCQLEGASSTSSIPISSETLQELFPGKVCSELVSWGPITWSDYAECPATRHIIDCGAVTMQDLFFKAVFKRQAVNLEAFVTISPDYPNIAPIFALRLLWGKEETASSNPHVRQMETELNIHYGELASNRSERLQLLSLQLYRLAMCFDILTEATSIQKEANVTPSQTQFHKEKIFFRPARGPDRALPFKYLPKLGVFAQR
ncbi:UNVERIFIED_CONTAM: hypothetical protein RMT77_004025 [Armadillidium vulgare]|nr:THO complex subunit 5-like protein B [Armadillidium vulgare]